MTDAFTAQRPPLAVSTSGIQKAAGGSGAAKGYSSRSLEPIISGIPFQSLEDALESISDSPRFGDASLVSSEELTRKDTPPPADMVHLDKLLVHSDGSSEFSSN